MKNSHLLLFFIFILSYSVKAQNHYPKAKNDTITIENGDSLLINVAANDTDIDAADSLCLFGISGTHASWASIVDCKHIKYQSADTNFYGLDSIQYGICDNQNPPLCATAYLIVNVKPNKTLLPISVIGTRWDNHLAFFCGEGYLVNKSINYEKDSLVQWDIKNVSNSVGRDTILYGDSVKSNPFQYFSTQGLVVFACLTVKNNHGASTLCDTFNYYCEGINEIPLANISIYPNPANNILIVDMSENEEAIIRSYTLLEIYNEFGEKVKFFSKKEEQFKIVTLNISDFEHGFYFLSLTNGKERRSIGRFIK
jgi:hypothetical protein